LNTSYRHFFFFIDEVRPSPFLEPTLRLMIHVYYIGCSFGLMSVFICS
jgi:hypothetical protein